MSSTGVLAPPEVGAAFDALDAAVARIGELNLDACDPVVRLRALERMETSRREQAVTGHDLIAGLAKEDPADIGGAVHKVIADWLRISYTEARRRVRDAEQLAPRITLTGQTLPPELPATARAWRAGLLDGQHLRVIQSFVRDLPESTPPDTVERAERFLAEQAATLRPDQLEKVANRCAVLINPDGKFSDADRARQRGFTWCAQRPDGMSLGKLIASPELRANLDAWLARFAAPGMCNPDDPTPCVTGQPGEDAVHKDLRSHTQRQHDALNALVRGQLGDPRLGAHNGLPVAVIVSTTLKELTTGAGHALTGGGTLLPMRDLIRMACHAYHYLAVFDEHDNRPLYLGRSKRIASADQRVVLYAKDRGCTRPGCDVPGYWCEVHHLDNWARGGQTDIDKLTFTCKPDHNLTEQGWRTTKLANGATQWIPPAKLDHGQPRTNDYHHPERLFTDDDPEPGSKPRDVPRSPP
ncbi:HNH endonuclease [Mycobacterium sp. SM1]|uniref:HNH endonuclease signature motif containing protein n=1 Tax=Mycobacterium sp. SM1 TaxID=2816243 RepID=UPI001BCAA825|nr:HNH endonuclease signature motif containing protein [Mycobacterium sp. SM1]MBS4729697.1 HNH endonuclease [Mycobacterium sp. SM1]